MSISEALYETLRLAQRLGFFGPGDLERAVAHAGHFAVAVPTQAELLIDLGSGGGLPALVIAEALPHLSILLVERRQARADFLERAVRRLDFSDRITVLSTDVATLAADSDYASKADVVTARGFAPPHVVAPLAASLVRPGGVIIVSDPPQVTAHERWFQLPLGSFDLEFASTDGVVSVLHHL